jgi:DNA-damage-inducible protein J
MANTEVRVRIDEHTKDLAAAVLSEIGLTVSDAVRLLMVRIARDGALPFDRLIPNAETISAIEEARAGNLKGYANVEDLMKSLNEDD